MGLDSLPSSTCVHLSLIPPPPCGRHKWMSPYVAAETEVSKTQDGVLWTYEASKRYGKGYDVGMRRGKKKIHMEEIHTLSGMSLAELRGAAEDWDLWRKLTMTIAGTLRADSTRCDRSYTIGGKMRWSWRGMLIHSHMPRS